MCRLIDADALLEKAWDADTRIGYVRVVDVGDVLEAPGIELVRCRDCKHYRFADNRAFGMPVKMCEWFGFEDVDDNDFCSMAERRRG